MGNGDPSGRKPVYKRPGSRYFWMRYRAPDGTRMWKSTGQVTEADALAVYEGTLAELRGERPKVDRSPMTVRKYAGIWLEARRARELESIDDDDARLSDHVLPVLGDVVLADLKRPQVQEFARGLRKRISKRTKKPLAPRTQHHVYDVLRQLCRDAMAEERLAVDPCVLKRGDLPSKRDADPNWRPTAVFDTREVALLISDGAIPMDRRIWYALHFLTGMRPGEGAAVRWLDHDARAKPLGRITCARAYNRGRKRVKGTKTEQPRYLPVHPVLAELLREWKAGPWQDTLREWRAIQNLPDEAPKPEDLIVPSRRCAPRSNSLVLKRFKEDLARLGLRARRAYDSRRTFTSLTQADGARRDVIEWLTHPPTDQTSQYTTLPWPTLCEAVGCWKIRRLSQVECDQVKAELSREAAEVPGETGDSAETDAPRQEKTAVDPRAYGGSAWRGVRDSNVGPAPQSSEVESGADWESQWLRAKLRARALEARQASVSAVSGKRGGIGGRERAVAVGVRPARPPAK
jgi:integrase